MKIVLNFDKSRLLEYHKRGSPVVFGISWEHQGIYYPSSNWIDFGGVILAWWLGVIWQMQKGNHEGTFQFMDGPYSIKAKHYLGEGIVELFPSGVNFIWKVSFNQIMEEVSEAANRVCQELKELGIGAETQNSLEKAILLLEIKK